MLIYYYTEMSKSKKICPFIIESVSRSSQYRSHSITECLVIIISVKCKITEWSLRSLRRCLIFWEPELAQVSWPVLSSSSVSNGLSMVFPICLFYILEFQVRYRFESLFSKDLKNRIYFVTYCMQWPRRFLVLNASLMGVY